MDAYWGNVYSPVNIRLVSFGTSIVCNFKLNSYFEFWKGAIVSVDDNINKKDFTPTCNQILSKEHTSTSMYSEVCRVYNDIN